MKLKLSLLVLGLLATPLRAATEMTGDIPVELAKILVQRPDVLLQDYLVGLGGGDVTPDNINAIIDDLNQRQAASPPEWKDTSQ